MRTICAAIAIAVAFATATAGASPARAGEYSGPGLSARLLMEDATLGKGRITGRYYFDRGGFRMELDNTGNRAVIFNSFSGIAIVISRAGGLRTEEQRGKAEKAQFGDDPCAGFARKTMASSEIRRGRSLQVWQCSKPRQALLDAGVLLREQHTVWYDPELKHFIRIESSTGAWIELRNIRRARQPPALFEAPTDFGQFLASSQVEQVEAVRLETGAPD